MAELILASASRSRAAVLHAAGIAFTTQTSGVDESAMSDLEPEPQVRVLATAKAMTVANSITGDAVVLGCDSMLVVNGRALGKPHDADEARRWWHRRAGTSADLLTGHCLVTVVAGQTGQLVDAVVKTTVHFGAPTDDEIDAYVATGEPLAAAGGFTIEGFGAPFVRGVTGDPNNVLGLSLPVLRELLADVGLSITDFWPT